MTRVPSHRTPIARAAALAVTAAALAIAGCGDEDEEIPPLTSPEPATTTTTTTPSDEGAAGEAEPPPPGKPSGPAESGAGDPRVTELERDAERVVRELVAALNDRDGERACALLAPGVALELELPKPSPSCPAALDASIGYRDPRGLPVWERAEVARVRSVELDDKTAKVVATVVTRFADREEPSIEDDVLYLTRLGGRWLIAKPSATLYRAVGIADVPPSALAPP